MRFNLFLLISRKAFSLLIIYILLSLLIMNFNDAVVLRGVRIFALQMVEWISNIQQNILEWKDYRAENEMLRRENFKLKLQLQRLQEIVLENQRLKALLNFKKDINWDIIPSRIIGAGQEEGIHSVILDVGERDGVEKNMPVITADGLVGKIIATTPSQSIVQILMDPNCMVSARLQKSREVGVVRWSGNPWLELLYIPKNVVVEKGELVVTSGLSQIYPPGIKIGTVARVEENQFELYKKIYLKPAVNFNHIEEAFVVMYPGKINSRNEN